MPLLLSGPTGDDQRLLTIAHNDNFTIDGLTISRMSVVTSLVVYAKFDKVFGRRRLVDMENSRLHHVTVMSNDLDRSIAFYTQALGLQQIERPPFPNKGAWLATADFIVHLNLNPDGAFRNRKVIDGNDIHFAIGVDDFQAAVAQLLTAGYHETDDEDDPCRIIVKRSGLAGFPQFYVMDPEGNVIEINAASE